MQHTEDGVARLVGISLLEHEAGRTGGSGKDGILAAAGDQRFEQARPIRAGDELVGMITIDTLRAAAGMDMIGTRTEISMGVPTKPNSSRSRRSTNRR